MKKATSILLAVILLSSLFAGCGNGPQTPVSVNSPISEAATEAAQSDSTEEATAQEAEETTQSEQAEDVTMPEAVIYDADGVKITATGKITSDSSEKYIGILVENNTDKNIAYSGGYFVVNGATMGGWLYIEVAAGKKANGSLEIYCSDLEKAGIEELATIAAPDAYIYDTDSYETIADAPFDLSTSIADTYSQSFNATGDVVFDQDGVKITAQYINDTFYGSAVTLFVENNTGEDIEVDAENVSVNGFTIDAWLYDTVFNDTVRFSELDIAQSGLDENGIESVEEVTFTIHIYDTGTFTEISSSDELQIFVNQ